MSGQERASSVVAEGRRLRTWKEIATFLGCDARTARRWEATRALPVHRFPNGSRSAVYAWEAELQRWLQSAPPVEPGSPHEPALANPPLVRPYGRVPMWAAAATAALLLVLGLAWSQARLAATLHVPPAGAEALYRDGLYGWQSRTPAGLARAIDDYRSAVRIDPKYAAAWAELAVSYDLVREYTTVSAATAFPAAKDAAERALALDPSQTDAHAALGFVDFHWLHDAGAAEREFRTALALSPNSSLAHHWYATFLLPTGNARAALAEIDAAQKLDSESGAILADKGLILAAAGRAPQGIAILRQLELTQPLFSSPPHYLEVIYRREKQDGPYLREFAKWAALRRDASDASIAAAGLHGFAAGGHAGMLRAMLAEEQRLARQGKTPLYDVAHLYAELGQPEEAIRSLRQSLARRDTDSAGFRTDPAFAGLKQLPEFRALAENDPRFARHTD